MNENINSKNNPAAARIVFTCDNDADNKVDLKLEGNPDLTVQLMSCSMMVFVSETVSKVLNSNYPNGGISKKQIIRSEEALLSIITSNVLAMIHRDGEGEN